MTEWAAKRFWSGVDVTEADGGFQVQLDGRPVRTPGKSVLRLPTEALARLVAEEWVAVDEMIDPRQMPATRMANSAIAKVVPQMEAVVDHLAAYGETDLLCYRAEGPESLVARQAEAWDPWLDWAAETFGARLVVTAGIVPVDQPKDAVDRLRGEVAALGAFELAALHDLVMLPGSLVLGLAAARGAAGPDALWQVSRLDEIWQAELWGQDEEAERAAAAKAAGFADAAKFFACARAVSTAERN